MLFFISSGHSYIRSVSNYNFMSYSSNSEYKYFTIAFYNLENLFDTVDDHRTLDDDFTENSDKNWNEKRFRKKVKKLGGVISPSYTILDISR